MSFALLAVATGEEVSSAWRTIKRAVPEAIVMVGTYGPSAEFIKLVADYQAAQAFDPTLAPDFVSLEGYLSGRLTAAALENLGPNPTRAGLLRAIDDVGRFDISGSIFTVGVRAIETPPKVFLTVIQKDGTFKAVDRL